MADLTTRKRMGPVSWFVAALLILGLAVTPAFSATAEVVEAGDSVFIGGKQGYGGTGVFPIWSSGVQEGDPDYWAYCIEQPVSARTGLVGTVGDSDDFLGSNFFTDPEVQGKVRWILAHSYPALSLTEFGAAVGVPAIARNDAIEATQYAIWRYTELTFDAAWNFETADSATAYWYLIDGANSHPGLTSDDVDVTADVTAPSSVQTAGSLVGPFVVDTNQPSVTVSVDPTYAVTDAAGAPIDLGAVVDGQELYLDIRGQTSAGTAVVQVSAAGTRSTGKIVSVPTTPGGTPTSSDHAQSVILVTPSTTRTTAEAAVSWAAAAVDTPSIGTSLVDQSDGDRVLPASGGMVIDTVTFENLTPGAEYRLDGELMRKSDGSPTGIIGSVTFTPTGASGSVEVPFTVPSGFAGEALVAFEWLFPAGSTEAIAEHTDIDDLAQTVSVDGALAPVPSIRTSATTGNVADNKILPISGGVVTDVVTWENLPECVLSDGECLFVYVVEGELMRLDGETVTSTGMTATSDEFTIGEGQESGSINVTFEVSAEQAEQFAGETLVVFERLRLWNYSLGSPETEIVAVHEDPTDAAQTVTVADLPAAAPLIGTSLVDSADGDRLLPWDGGTVVDTVTYRNLTPGMEYTVIGELMDSVDGVGTGITGSTRFTPIESDGSVDVVFVVPEGFAGRRLVAFEVLYVGADATGSRVAAHEDLDDPAQTVVIEDAPLTPTPVPTPTTTPVPTSTPTPVVSDGGDEGLASTGATAPTTLVAAALIAVLAGAALLLLRRRTHS